jgi:hypothetical protein
VAALGAFSVLLDDKSSSPIAKATLAAAVVPPAPPSSGEPQPVLVPDKYYSASDKERISEILFSVSDAIHIKTKHLMQNIHHVASWQSPVPELAPILSSVGEMRTSITDLRAIFVKITSENANYRAELGPLLSPGDTAIEKLQNGLSNYYDALAAFKDAPSPRSVRLLTMGREFAIQSGYNPFHQWMMECQKSIEATQKALER